MSTSKNANAPKWCIICDAGNGTRALPSTKAMPKGYLPVGGFDTSNLIIAKEAAKAGLKVMLVVRPEDVEVEDKLFNGEALELRESLAKKGKYDLLRRLDEVPNAMIVAQDQNLPYGNAAPIITAMKYLPADVPIVACYGDDLTFGASDIQKLLDTWNENPGADGVIMGQEVNDDEVVNFGMIKEKGNDEHLLDHIVEKPHRGEQPSNLASYGRYLLGPKVLEALKQSTVGKGGEIWTVDAITEVAKTGKIVVAKTDGEWHTTGNLYAYLIANLRGTLDTLNEMGRPDGIDQIIAMAEHYQKYGNCKLNQTDNAEDDDDSPIKVS